MKILVIGVDVPASASMPGSPRLFSLCRELAARHRLTLLTLKRSEERYRSFLADPMTAGVFEEMHALPPLPEASWSGRQMHRLRRGAFFLTRFRAPEYYRQQCQRVRDLYVRGGFDAIFADGLASAQYVEGANLGSPAVIDLHDCLTLLFQRTQQLEARWLPRLQLYAETRSIARVERSLHRTFDTVITNSEVDEAFLRQLNPDTNTLTIGNGVDGDFFRASDVEVDPTKLVFTGVMNYGPNEDAAVFFAETVLPMIHRRHPEMQFWVVGKDPGPKVQGLASSHVRVTGSVPDVRPYVQSAAIFVSPLRYGTGIKNKLLAALAMRKPVVATTRTVEGLALRDGQDVLVADDPADFAAKVVQLLENPALAKQLAESGHAFVRERYSWESSALALENALVAAVERRNPTSKVRTIAR